MNVATNFSFNWPFPEYLAVDLALQPLPFSLEGSLFRHDAIHPYTHRWSTAA